MTAAAAPVARRRGGRLRGESLTAYGLVAPNLALLGLFVLLPLVWAAGLSLQRTDGFGSGEFVGLANYARLFTDPGFWRVLLNTVGFTLLTTPPAMALGLGAAVLLNAVLPARGAFRTILVLPMAVSGVATALMGLLLFDQSGGLFNKLLVFAGLPAVPWQSDGVAAFASVVLVTLWWRVGFNMLIYLSALQGISPELYEAARMDGATGWRQFRHITVPLVGPASFFLLVLNVIYSFQVFDVVFVLTGGGPGNATAVLVTYAYENGFVVRDQGYAAAIGMVLLVLMVVFAAVQWRTNPNRDSAE